MIKVERVFSPCRQGEKLRSASLVFLGLLLKFAAYAAAGVHVLPSWMETCGLVTLEAALSGTPVVGSTFGHELEYLQQDAWHADPADPSTIRDAVIQAWQAGHHNSKSCRLKRRILEQFNWEQTTDATESIYKKVLNGTV